MRVEIVHDQYDPFRFGIGRRDFKEEKGPIPFRLFLGDANKAGTVERLDRPENIADTAAFIFIIVACGPPRATRQERSCFVDQLAR